MKKLILFLSIASIIGCKAKKEVPPPPPPIVPEKIEKADEVTIKNTPNLKEVLDNKSSTGPVAKVDLQALSRKVQTPSAEIRTNYPSQEYSTEHETHKVIDENNFKKVSKDPISTFSVDVDKASYSNVRRMINNGYLPDKDAIRVEEMINYFDYDYPEPTANSDVPFRVSTQLSNAPWNNKNYLLQIGLQAKKIKMEDTPPSNIVFLIDV